MHRLSPIPICGHGAAREVEADGKTVKLNTKETIESVKFLTALWKEAHDEGGLAWDDFNNNRAFLSGTISATLNGASIYIESLRKPDQYKTDKGAQLKSDIVHAPLPKGPAGQFGYTLPVHDGDGLFEEPKAGDGFLSGSIRPRSTTSGSTAEGVRHRSHQAVGEPQDVGRGSGDGPLPVAPRLGRVYGHAGPAGPKAAEVLSKYIIVDMYAKAVQGMSAEDAVKWADGEVRRSTGDSFQSDGTSGSSDCNALFR